MLQKGRWRANGIRGEAIGTSKLKESDVRAILSDERSQVAIARSYGVSNVLIGKIKRREIWTHVKIDEIGSVIQCELGIEADELLKQHEAAA